MVKKQIKKVINLIVILALLFGLCGCNNKEKSSENEKNEIVFEFGDNQVSLGEFYIYELTMSQGYVEKYGIEVWSSIIPDEQGEMVSLSEMVKEDVVESIVRILTINSKADDYGIKLTSVDKTNIKEQANEFFNNLTDKEINDMELTVETVEKVLSDNKLAELVYSKMMDNANIEVSSEEARMTTYYDMFFPCYKKDSEGNVSPFTEAQKDKQQETALNVYGEMMTAEFADMEITNIEEFATKYKLDESSIYTMSPNEIKEIYGERVCDTIYELNDGDYSIVIESDYGFHVFYMVSLTDEIATRERKLQMESKLKEEKFQELYSTWRKGIDKEFIYPDSINMDVLNKTSFN